MRGGVLPREARREVAACVLVARGRRRGGGHRRGGRGRRRCGRPLRGREYGDDTTVKVPGEIDVQRARRIIEELRKRFGDFARPQDELDYIQRLLKNY